jgi:hypothetical protein
MRFILSLVLAAAVASPAFAASIQSMQSNAETKRFAACVQDYVESLGLFGAVEDDVELVLSAAVGKLAAGSKQTVLAVVRECIANAKSEPRSEQQWTPQIERYLEQHFADVTTSTNFPNIRRAVAACTMIADGAANGGDPERTINTSRWSGTIADFRKLCAQGEELARKAKPAFLAIYRSFQNDKLARITDDPTGYGARDRSTGGLNDGLDVLASASVWFRNHYGMPCANHHQAITVERLEFDRAHKLTKASRSQIYCGTPPADAYK